LCRLRPSSLYCCRSSPHIDIFLGSGFLKHGNLI
jgi:hypothetical protein